MTNCNFMAKNFIVSAPVHKEMVPNLISNSYEAESHSCTSICLSFRTWTWKNWARRLWIIAKNHFKTYWAVVLWYDMTDDNSRLEKWENKVINQFSSPFSWTVHRTVHFKKNDNTPIFSGHINQIQIQCKTTLTQRFQPLKICTRRNSK